MGGCHRGHDPPQQPKVWVSGWEGATGLPSSSLQPMLGQTCCTAARMSQSHRSCRSHHTPTRAGQGQLGTGHWQGQGVWVRTSRRILANGSWYKQGYELLDWFIKKNPKCNTFLYFIFCGEVSSKLPHKVCPVFVAL